MIWKKVNLEPPSKLFGANSLQTTIQYNKFVGFDIQHWVSLNFNQIMGSRQTKFSINTTNRKNE